MKKIGWIGIGNMGRNMARRVLDAGYELYLFDANKQQMQQLLYCRDREVFYDEYETVGSRCTCK